MYEPYITYSIRSTKEEKARKVDAVGPIGSDHYNNKTEEQITAHDNNE
jgi:hypothetical protein